MLKTVVLIPETDNDGLPHPRAVWDELEGRLAAFGGLSRETGVAGVWELHGRLYRDVSRRYTAALRSVRQIPAWLAVVEWAREAFRQEAIYIELAGVPEVLEGPPSVR